VHHRMNLGRDVEESNQPKQANSWIGLVQHFIAPQARPRVRSGALFCVRTFLEINACPDLKKYTNSEFCVCICKGRELVRVTLAEP
jgi:hypothetical protein